MGILSLLTYLYEIPAGACLGYLILQTFCLILQISSRTPPFMRSILRTCTEGEVQCPPNSHLLSRQTRESTDLFLLQFLVCICLAIRHLSRRGRVCSVQLSPSSLREPRNSCWVTRLSPTPPANAWWFHSIYRSLEESRRPRKQSRTLG